jgi:6,7-dimethyl-8-ribityllumazine synthase
LDVLSLRECHTHVGRRPTRKSGPKKKKSTGPLQIFLLSQTRFASKLPVRFPSFFARNRTMARSTRPRFALVASTFNREFVDGLLAAASATLQGHVLTVVRVPGSFEIPLQVQRLARTKRYAAVIALGVVWQGKTAHADLIVNAVTDALMRIMLETDVPVIHEVLSIKTEAEARARCFGNKLNRGREAAEAALALLKLEKR